MKLRTRATAWIYMIIFAIITILALSALIYVFVVPQKMGFGGLVSIFAFLVSITFSVGWDLYSSNSGHGGFLLC